MQNALMSALDNSV